jgi:DNA-binding PadR family transcriptional regulator
MALLTHPSNPLALAVLALLFERPMHPYEMAATLKQRHKGESIKIRYGSLYTVIELLVKRSFITAKETSREGRRPERTVFALTPSGYDELHAWMQDLLRDPVNDYPQFAAGLSLLPVLPPEETVALLRHRALRLSAEATRIEAHLSELARQKVPVPAEELPPPLVGKKFPPLFVVETEFALALVKAELAFVNELVRRITEEGWGPLDLWRELQATCARQHQANGVAREGSCDPIANTEQRPDDAGTSPGPEPENRTRGARWLQARSHKLTAKARREQRPQYAGNGRRHLLSSQRSVKCPNHSMS